MAEEKIQLIIEWLERNPEYAKAVEKKLAKLNTAYEAAENALINYNKPLQEQRKQYEALMGVTGNYAIKMMKTFPAFRMMTDAQAAQQQQLMAGVTKWTAAGKHVEAFGRKVGFTGFIVTFSIQRIIRTLGQFIKYFTDSIKAVADWPDKLMDVAYALGMLQYSGLATAETQKVLSDTMSQLVAQGPKVESLWLGLQALWTSIQTTLATALIPALTTVLNQLGAFLIAKETQAAIANLGVAVGQLFESLVTAAPMILYIVTVFAQLLKALGPFFPIIIPLVSIMLVLGMVCSMLGPIFTVLGAVIGTLVKIKRIWLVQTNLNAVAMQRLKLSIISTIATLAILGIILWGLSRAAASSATDISKSFDDLSTASTKMEWTITDANGNVIYTINTLDNTVKDSSGNIIGYYDSMLNVIIDNNGQIRGSLDETSGTFTSATGEVGKLDKGMSDLAAALAKGFDTGKLNAGLDAMTTSTDTLNDSMNALYVVMGLIAAVQLGGLILQIGQLATAMTGLGVAGTSLQTTLTPFLVGAGGALTAGGAAAGGGALAIAESLFPPLAILLAAQLAKGAIETTYTPEQKAAIDAIEKINKMYSKPWWDLSPRGLLPVGQFGIPRVPKTGSYWLEKGEKVEATRDYGPPEEGTTATVVTETPQMISITNYIEVGQISTELDAEKLGDVVNRKIAEGFRRKRP